jgi:hypothetical protein
MLASLRMLLFGGWVAEVAVLVHERARKVVDVGL